MNYARIHFIVEGQTEENFVNDVLKVYLADYSLFADVRCVETSRDRRTNTIYRGGLLNYEKAKGDIIRWMKEDKKKDCRFTTMFDFYALPTNFPGFDNACTEPYQKTTLLEESFQKDIADERFVPYIQLYEFETLIFADPSKLFEGNETQIKNLCGIVEQYKNPELINGGQTTSPSKRIINEFAAYEKRKVVIGTETVKKIGIEKLLERCKHFSEWIGTLKRLVQ